MIAPADDEPADAPSAPFGGSLDVIAGAHVSPASQAEFARRRSASARGYQRAAAHARVNRGWFSRRGAPTAHPDQAGTARDRRRPRAGGPHAHAPAPEVFPYLSLHYQQAQFASARSKTADAPGVRPVRLEPLDRAIIGELTHDGRRPVPADRAQPRHLRGAGTPARQAHHHERRRRDHRDREPARARLHDDGLDRDPRRGRPTGRRLADRLAALPPIRRRDLRRPLRPLRRGRLPLGRRAARAPRPRRAARRASPSSRSRSTWTCTTSGCCPRRRQTSWPRRGVRTSSKRERSRTTLDDRDIRRDRSFEDSCPLFTRPMSAACRRGFRLHAICVPGEGRHARSAHRIRA